MEPEPPYKWVKAKDGRIPPNAVYAGPDLHGDVYVARGWHSGQLIPGKVVRNRSFAYLPWKGEEVEKRLYEVLVAPPERVKWVPPSGGEIPRNAIEGGFQDTDGNCEIFYIGRALVNGFISCGKVSPTLGTCTVSLARKEHVCPHFGVLVYEEPAPPKVEFPSTSGVSEQPTNIQQNFICKICSDCSIEYAFFCGHVICLRCKDQIGSRCPYCNQNREGTRLYF